MHITHEQHTLLEKHLDMVLQANERTNITRITGKQQGMLLHVEDSLVGLEEMEEAPEGPYADMGSGAGYPGIPLAIATGRRTTLIESVGKKAALLDGFVRELGLAGRVEAYSGRTEELARVRPEAYAAVTARALASLPSLMELASPLLMQGGLLVCYKAGEIGDELDWSYPLQDKLAMRFVSSRKATLSDAVTQRSIIVYRKEGVPKVVLPRREGQAQRRPYRK